MKEKSISTIYPFCDAAVCKIHRYGVALSNSYFQAGQLMFNRKQLHSKAGFLS